MAFIDSIKPYAGTVGLSAIRQGTTLLSGFILIRALTGLYGKETFGNFALYQAIFAYLLIPTLMGFDKLIIYRVAGQKSAPDGTIHGMDLVGELKKISLFVFICLDLPLVAQLLLIPPTSVNNSFFWICIFSINTALNALGALYTALFQANKEASTALSIGILSNLLRLLCLASIYFLGPKCSYAIISYLLLPNLLSVFTFEGFLRRRSPTSEPVSLNRRDIIYSIKLMLLRLTHSGLEKVDLVMVGAMLGTLAAADYALAARLALIVPLGNMLMEPLFGPRLRYAIANKTADSVREEFTLNMNVATGIGLGILSIYFASSPYLLNFFGDYGHNATLLSLLSLAFFNRVAAGPIGRALYLMGHPGYSLISNLILLLAIIASNILFIRIYGVIGAAIGTFVCIFVQNLTDHVFFFFKMKYSLLGIRRILFILIVNCMVLVSL